MEVYQTVSEWDGNYSTQPNNTQPNTQLSKTTNDDDSQTLETAFATLNTENGQQFDCNHSEMISSTKQNDVDNSLAADKAVSDLSEEQLRDVLEQLTDHSLPDSEKCPLVRRLNAENASKEEPDLVISAFCKSSTISCRNSGRKSRYLLHRTGSKDAEFVRDKTSGKDKKVHSSQSLQDLLSTNSEYDSYSMRSIGATRNGKRLNKASRANSFTMPSGSQHFCTNTTTTTTTTTMTTTTATASAYACNTSNNNTNDEMTDQTKWTHNGGKAAQTRWRSSKARASSYISTSSVTAVCANDSNNCDFEPEVVLNASPLMESPISSLNYQECYATQSIHVEHETDNNHNMDCDNNNSSNLCNTAPEQHYSNDSEFIEMKDLRKKANIIEYTSEKQNNDCFESDSYSYQMHNNKSYNNVDSFLDLGLTNATNSKNTIKTGIAERIVNHNTDYDATDSNKALQPYPGMDVNRSYNETASSNPYSDSDLANLQPISPNNKQQQDLSAPTNARDKKKKKSERTNTILAEQIEGHVGYNDIEYLTSYINSAGNEQIKQTSPDINKNSTSSSKETSSGKKKERANIMNNYALTKRKNANNTSPNRNTCATDLNKNVSNIPLSTSTSSCSSDDSNNNKHSEIAQNTDLNIDENTSLLNSSSRVKELASITRDNLDNLVENTQSFHLSNNMTSAYSLRNNATVDEHQYAASDGEMPADIGFVVPKSKHFKRRKARRVDIYGNHCSPIASVQSSTSTTPPSSTFSGNAMFARGYESEREYNFDSKYKQDVMRRKSTSSVCQSEQTSYNSDGELSSHSMPARNDNSNTNTRNIQHSRTNPSSIDSTPKASYADIAKSFNFGMNSYLKSHNTYTTPLSVNTSDQYEEFPELDTSLTPVADAMPAFNEISNSKIVEALVSPPPTLIPENRGTNFDSYSAPTSSTNTPIPQNEYLLSESIENNRTESLKSAKLSDVPPVIMCDYLESVQPNDIGSVTFGFFDDIPHQTPDDCLINESDNMFNDNLYNDMAASHGKPSPESDEHRISNFKLIDIHKSYIDVDKKSFNYEQLISFIRREWENARNDCKNSYQSTNEVNYRS